MDRLKAVWYSKSTTWYVKRPRIKCYMDILENFEMEGEVNEKKKFMKICGECIICHTDFGQCWSCN